MFDMRDTTFLIPFRYDSEDRIRNLRAVISYLTHNLDTNIIVMEESPQQMFFDTGKFVYKYNHTTSPLLHRTRMLNDMCKMSRTPIIVLQDTDVLITPKYLWDSAQLIRSNQADMVYPYSGLFINFLEPYISRIIQSKSVEGLTEKEGHWIHSSSKGGCIFFNRMKFIMGGMENAYFFSWGWEDDCRLNRFTKLGYRVMRTPGFAYHLNHASSLNSANTSHEPYHNNRREFEKVANMNKEQLQAYINTWPWLK